MRETRRDVESLLSHEGFLRALARSILRDESRADDVVQQTYLAALRRSPCDPGRLRAWLARVTKNFALRSLRETARRKRREQGGSRPEASPSAEEIRAREETRRRVVEAVLGLAEPYRTAVVLRYLEGLPPRKVARRLGVPVQTVYTRLKRALPLLRARLDDTWDGGRNAWTLALLPLAFPKSATAAPTVATEGVLLMRLKAKLAAATVLLAAGLVGYLALHERAPGDPAALHAQGHEKALSAKGPRKDSKDEGSGAAGQGKPQATTPQNATLQGIVRGGGKPLCGAVVQVTGKEVATIEVGETPLRQAIVVSR